VKRLSVALMGIPAIFAVVAAAKDLPAGDAAPRAATVARLQTELEAAVADKRIPGATVVVTRGGRVLADVTTGWADIAKRVPLRRDAIFRLFSMSKPITSVGIMMLAERGKLKLDDPVARFLPELSNVQVYVSGGLDDMVTRPPARAMTIADLLTHRSGITYHFTGATPVHQYYRKYGVLRDTPVGRLPTDGPPARSLDELVARLGKAPLLHDPGQTFAYSYSTTVLGALIQRVTGERLDRWMDREIFKPLDMKDATFIIRDAQVPRFTVLYGPAMTEVERPEASEYRNPARLLDGGGAIATTTDDYLHFAQMLADGGIYRGKRLLRPASIDALFTPRTKTVSGGPPQDFGYGFAIGDAATEAVGIQPAGTASWSGSANTYFFVDRRRRAVGLFMTHVMGGAAGARASANRAAIALIRAQD
jgi:CubicO group peptidase (beta-lactamase class C family)